MADSCMYQSPIGVLRIGEENGKITNLNLWSEEEDGMILKASTRHSDLLNEACRQLTEYFQGKRREFELPLGYNGTQFQQRVWKQLLMIPYGETASYEDIAVRIGNPKAQRAVGQANNRNPLMILIPCHRVIHKNGEISGYACGIEAKRYLLALERRT